MLQKNFSLQRAVHRASRGRVDAVRRHLQLHAADRAAGGRQTRQDAQRPLREVRLGGRGQSMLCHSRLILSLEWLSEFLLGHNTDLAIDFFQRQCRLFVPALTTG